MPAPMVLVVMGVSGSGKSTVGALLGERLGREYADADDFHPAANIDKMRSGVPLDDTDRWPWLRRIAAWIDERVRAGAPVVVSCSALKRAYRDQLRRPQVLFVYLDGDRDLIAGRMAARQGHFFRAAMLDGQFRALEPPEPDERAHRVPITGTPEETVDRVLAGLQTAWSS